MSTAVQTSTADAIALFVECIYEHGDIVEVRRLPAGGSAWCLAAELPSKSDELTADNKRGLNIYAGANPQKCRGDGTRAKDCKEGQCGACHKCVILALSLFADFDGMTVHQARSAWEAAGMPEPTLVLNSGHGVHAYWRLTEPITQLASFERWQADLAAHLGSDPAIKDSPRIMRLPGFANVKDPEQPVPVKIISAAPGRRYDLSDLHELVPHPEHTAQPEREAASGDPIPEGKRNKTLASLAGTMRKRGMSHDAINAALLAENEQKCSPPLPRDEVERIAESVAHYEPARPTDPPEWSNPIPLGQFNVPKFPAAAMPEALQPLTDCCDAVSESLQVPADMPYVLALTVGATALARKIEVQVSEDHVEPVNIFGVVVQPPACRKTAAIARMFAPVGEFERQENERLAPALEDNANERAILVGALKEARSQASKAKNDLDRRAAKQRAKEVSEELRNLKPMYPLQLTADDITPEAVASCLHQQGGRLAIVSAEGGIFQQIGGRYSKNGMPNLDVFLKGHAGDDIRVDRVSKDRLPEYIKAPALTLALTVQPDVLHGLMEQRGFRGRGLLARFLYSLPVSTIGRRNLHPKPIPPNVASQYRLLIREALALEPIDGADGPTPHILTVGAEATVELDAFKAEIESGLAVGGAHESMRDFFGKLVGAVCRIAGILHGLQYAGSGALTDNPIDGPTMHAGIEVGRYFGEHAKAAYYEMGTDPAIEVARRIIGSLATEPGTEITKRDLWQRLKGGLNRADELDEPLRLLVEHEYLREAESENKRQGWGADYRSQRYLVNPNLPNEATVRGE